MAERMISPNRPEMERWRDLSKRKLRMVEKGLCQIAVWNHQDDDRTFFYEGIGLFTNAELSEEDFPFESRVYSSSTCPDVELFSLQETLAYMKDPKNKHILLEDSVDRVKRFWEKYPDGMITFM